MNDALCSDAPAATQPGVGREIELKLDVPSGDLAALRRDPRVRALAASRPALRRLRTVYYDTAGRDLARAGLALRVRTSARVHVQALKSEGTSQGGLFVRGEWEARVPSAAPDLARIPDPAARARARAAVGAKPLVPVFETDFQRAEMRLRSGGDELALALDEGEIRAKEGALPIREVELELVRGRPRALYDVALALHEVVPLRPAVASKAERGYALAAGTRPGARRARAIAIAPDAGLEEALSAVLAACLEHVLANLAPAAAGESPEGVHQLRVALRRTRAALALFRGVLPREPARGFAGSLRALARRLGPARELDVVLAETLEPLAARAPRDAGLRRLRDAARALRDEAYAGVREAVDAPATSGLALALGAWLAGRGWREGAEAASLAALDAPARGLAGELLERRLRKALARGRRLARRSPEERHRLRIQLKKLRYAAEFLQGLYPDGSPARTLKALSRLQDTLGHLNDVAAMERHLGRIADRLGPAFGPAERRAAARVTDRTARVAKQRLAALERQWQAFRRAKPFWRS